MNQEEALKRLAAIENEAAELRKVIEDKKPVVGGVYEHNGRFYMITNRGTNVLLNTEYAGETDTYSADKVAEWGNYLGKLEYKSGAMEFLSDNDK